MVFEWKSTLCFLAVFGREGAALKYLTSLSHSQASSVVQADHGVAVGNRPLCDSRSAGSWARSPSVTRETGSRRARFPFGFLLFYFLHFSCRALCSCPMRTEGSHFVVFGEKNVFKSLILFRSGSWHECAMRVVSSPGLDPRGVHRPSGPLHITNAASVIHRFYLIVRIQQNHTHHWGHGGMITVKNVFLFLPRVHCSHRWSCHAVSGLTISTRG